MKFIDIICLFIAAFQDKGDCFMLVCTIVLSRIVSQSWCSLVQLLLVMKHLFWKFLTLFWHFFYWQTNRPMKGDVEALSTELKNYILVLNCCNWGRTTELLWANFSTLDIKLQPIQLKLQLQPIFVSKYPNMVLDKI